MIRVVFLLVLWLWALPGLALANSCGSGGRCTIEGGYYLAELPKDWDGKSKLALVVFFHGWSASPEGMFRNRAMVNGVTRRGAIFVAPYARTGFWRQIGEGRAEQGRDERAYVRALMADIRQRWPIDEKRTLASGFSRGASMVWNVACYSGPLFHAYLPIAGGFWNSNPETCPTGPVNMRHIHGTKDGVVAYREIGVYNSMPIPEGMAILRGVNQCSARPTKTVKPTRRLSCGVWSRCTTGRQLEVCLHDGGHSLPAEWVGEGVDWLATLPR